MNQSNIKNNMSGSVIMTSTSFHYKILWTRVQQMPKHLRLKAIYIGLYCCKAVLFAPAQVLPLWLLRNNITTLGWYSSKPCTLACIQTVVSMSLGKDTVGIVPAEKQVDR